MSTQMANENESHFDLYKRTQARLMRSLTVAGITLLVGWGLWALHNQLIAKKPDWEAKYLFSVRQDLSSDLDNQTIPKALQDTFQNKGFSLSQESGDVNVAVVEKGVSWTIKDSGRGAKYVLRTEDKELKVSRSGISASASSGIAYGVPGLLAVVSLWGMFRIYNWPRFADFLIATEAEMSKVSWSSKSELKRATAVVLLTLFLLTAFLLSVDIVWSWFLEKIGVLRPPANVEQTMLDVESWRSIGDYLKLLV